MRSSRVYFYKDWQDNNDYGDRPEGVTFELYAQWDGQAQTKVASLSSKLKQVSDSGSETNTDVAESKTVEKSNSITLVSANDNQEKTFTYAGSFGNLPAYSPGIVGKAITYTVGEVGSNYDS